MGMFVPSIWTENIIQIFLQIYVATKVDENEDNSIVMISLFGSVLQVIWNLLNCLVLNVLRSEGDNMSHKSDLLYKKYDKCVHDSIVKMQLVMAPSSLTSTSPTSTAKTPTIITPSGITGEDSTMIEMGEMEEVDNSLMHGNEDNSTMYVKGDNSNTYVKSEHSATLAISENSVMHVDSERL